MAQTTSAAMAAPIVHRPFLKKLTVSMMHLPSRFGDAIRHSADVILTAVEIVLVPPNSMGAKIRERLNQTTISALKDHRQAPYSVVIHVSNTLRGCFFLIDRYIRRRGRKRSGILLWWSRRRDDLRSSYKAYGQRSHRYHTVRPFNPVSGE